MKYEEMKALKREVRDELERQGFTKGLTEEEINIEVSLTTAMYISHLNEVNSGSLIDKLKSKFNRWVNS